MSELDFHWGSNLAHAVALASAFAATVPMPGATTVRFARAGLALALVPALVSGAPAPPAAIDAALRGVAIGATLGLAATLAFFAAGAAGQMTGAALLWSPLPDRDTSMGPIGYLYQLGFITVLFASGGFTIFIWTLVRASDAVPAMLFSPDGIARLMAVATRDCLSLAAPALFAQVLASLFAGLAARAAPQVGGLLMTSPLASLLVGTTLVAAAGSLLGKFDSAVSDSMRSLVLH